MRKFLLVFILLLSWDVGAVSFQYLKTIEGEQKGSGLGTRFLFSGNGLNFLAYPFWNTGIKLFDFDTGKSHVKFPSLVGPGQGTWGYNSAILEDVDGDSHWDIFLSSWNQSSIWVLSGKNGKRLHEFAAPKNKEGNRRYFIACSSIQIPDFDGDGILDYATSAAPLDRNGRIIFYSGKSGQEIFSAPTWPGDGIAETLLDIGDLDGDQVADLIVGSHNRDILRAFSVGRRKWLYEIPRVNGDGHCFNSDQKIVNMGDLNLDGVNDFAISDTTGYRHGSGTGRVQVFSGSDGDRLFEVHGKASNDYFGTAIAGGIDLDGDSFGDLVVGAPESRRFWGGERLGRLGYVQVISGQTGAVLLEIQGVEVNGAFGQTLRMTKTGNDIFLAVGAPEVKEETGEIYFFKRK